MHVADYTTLRLLRAFPAYDSLLSANKNNGQTTMAKIGRVSRRRFLKSSGAFTGAALLRTSVPALLAITQAACSAKQANTAFKILGANEAAEFAAIAARIIPTTDTPGAAEAGVIHFFDNAFASEMSNSLAAARAGLAEFNAALNESRSNATPFSALAADEQDAYLASRESSSFFELCWTMTMFGFFSMSKYGGNEGHLSWDLIGFDGNHGGWEYPFGHYDAEYSRETADGE